MRASTVVEAFSQEHDPKQAYLRLSSQLYNGGLEQLYYNEGNDWGRVLEIVQLAEQYAKAAPEWAVAKGSIMAMLKILRQSSDRRRDHNGRPLRDQWGNHKFDSDFSDQATAQADEHYMAAMDALKKVDQRLDVDDEVLSRGDPFGIDKKRQSAKDKIKDWGESAAVEFLKDGPRQDHL